MSRQDCDADYAGGKKSFERGWGERPGFIFTKMIILLSRSTVERSIEQKEKYGLPIGRLAREYNCKQAQEKVGGAGQ